MIEDDIDAIEEQNTKNSDDPDLSIKGKMKNFFTELSVDNKNKILKKAVSSPKQKEKHL